MLGRCAKKQRKFTNTHTHTHAGNWHKNHTHTHMRAWRVCHNAHKVQKDMRHEIHVLLMLKNEFVSTSCKRPTATPPPHFPLSTPPLLLVPCTLCVQRSNLAYETGQVSGAARTRSWNLYSTLRKLPLSSTVVVVAVAVVRYMHWIPWLLLLPLPSH